MGNPVRQRSMHPKPAALLLCLASACAQRQAPLPRPELRPAPESARAPASAVPTPPAIPTPVAHAHPRGAPSFPSPPGQADPAPPLPADPAQARWARAAWTLFESGMADPRGCAYQGVTVRVGSVWTGDAGTLEVHAWLLPAPAGQRRFAVAWNGLVYPVLSVGAPADLRADLAELTRAAAGPASRVPFPGEQQHSQEAFVAHHGSPAALKIPLLLRLGEHAAAALLARRFAAQGESEPLAFLAQEWTWAAFDRALTAHQRAEDDVALDGARRVALARERLVPLLGGADGGARVLDFLSPLDALLTDQERRARLAQPPTTDLARLRAVTDPHLRALAMAQGLESVQARQDGQPGGVDLASDPLVAALIAEGETAVPALLEVLESDERLTRSVHFWRDFSRHRTLLGVHEAAYAALATILQTTAFTAASTGDSLSARGPDGRRTVAAAVRAYWERWRGVSLHRRWYDTLRDPRSEPARMVEAANNIVQSPTAFVQRSSMVSWSTWSTADADGGAPRFQGEDLRALRGPSVTEALAQRMLELSARPPTSEFDHQEHACSLALALADWDAAGSLAPLRTFAATLRGAMDRDATTRSLRAHCHATLTLLRHRAGDAEALTSYGSWLSTLRPSHFRDDSVRAVFQPLAAYAQHPAMRAAGEALFGVGAPFATLLAPNEAVDAPPLYALLSAPELLRNEAFRANLERALADASPLGTLRWLGPRNYQLELGRVTFSGSVPEGEEPPLGHRATSPLRRAEVYAFLLTREAPEVRFRPYDEGAAREQGLAAVLRWARAR